jgi:uridine kinase
VRALFDLKIFVDVDADTRLVRRIRRDIKERGRSVEAVLGQYESTVKPSFESYILPTKKHADIIIPRGVDNIVAIDLLWQNIQYRISQTSPRTAKQGVAAERHSAEVSAVSHAVDASLGCSAAHGGQIT